MKTHKRGVTGRCTENIIPFYSCNVFSLPFGRRCRYGLFCQSILNNLIVLRRYFTIGFELISLVNKLINQDPLGPITCRYNDETLTWHSKSRRRKVIYINLKTRVPPLCPELYLKINYGLGVEVNVKCTHRKQE